MPEFEELGVRAVVRELGKFLGDLGRMNKGVQSSAQQMQKWGRGMQGAGMQLTKFVTLPIVALGAGSLKMASDFETAFTEVTTLFDLPKAQVASLREGVLELARTMGIDPVEAAKAMYQAISAGVAPAQVLKFLETNAKLAVGGVTDLETAVDLTTTVLNAFGLETSETARVADILFKGVEKGKTTIDELGASLFQVAPAASAAGIPIEQVTAALAALTAGGFPTAQAATALRAGFIELGKSGTIANTAFEEIAGVGFREFIAMGGTVVDVMALLAQKAEQDGVAVSDLFGSMEAGVAMGFLAVDLFDKLQDSLDATTNSAGAHEKAFDKMNATFGRQVTILKTELKVALIKLGTALIPTARMMVKVLRVVMKVINQMVEAFAALPKPIQIGIIAFFALLAAIGPVLVIVGTLLVAMGAFVALMPFISVALIWLAVGFAAVIIPILGVIGALLLLSAAALIILDNWDAISKFFSKDLPAAFEAAGAAIKATILGIPKFLSGVAAKAAKIGSSIINAVSKGIAAAASGLFKVVSQIVVGMIQLLNPVNWVMGSTMTEAYEKAGTRAGVGIDHRLLAAIKDGVPAIEDALAEPFEEVEDEAEEAGEDAGNAFIGALEDIVNRSMGAITSTLAAPLAAMRGIVQSLAGEIQRLAGLPSVESAQEDLARAQLAMKEAALRPALREAKQSRERIGDIDDEIDALVEQREKLIDLAHGHSAESDAVDNEIRALAKEKASLETSAQKAEDAADAIQEEIAALNDLAAAREAERDVAVARAAIADQTLATDKEILAALGTMEPVVREVTSAINAQVDDLMTRFIPAWQDAAGAMGAAGDADVGEFGELGEIDFTEINTALKKAMEEINAPLNDMIKDVRNFFTKAAPIFGLIGLGILVAIFLGWNIGLAVVVAGAVALLIHKFRKPILKFFGKLGKAIGKVVGKFAKFLKKHWKKIVQVALLVLFPPAGGLFALITNFEKIKDKVLSLLDKLVEGAKKLLSGLVRDVVGFFDELVRDVVGAVNDLVSEVVGLFTDLATDITGTVGGLIGDVVSLFSGLPEKLVSTLSGLVSEVAGVFADLPGAILSAIGDLGSLLVDVGKDLIDGLIKGFLSVTGFAMGIAEGIGNMVIGVLNTVIKTLWDVLASICIKKFGIGFCFSDVMGDAPEIPGLQRGLWKVPGKGTGDSVTAMLAPEEMVVPRALADAIRSRVGSFQSLADLISGRSGGSSELGSFMNEVGTQDRLEALPARTSVSTTIAFSAPISVTIQAQSWDEIRRLVHQEIDEALGEAQSDSERGGTELSAGIF